MAPRDCALSWPPRLVLHLLEVSEGLAVDLAGADPEYSGKRT